MACAPTREGIPLICSNLGQILLLFYGTAAPMAFLSGVGTASSEARYPVAALWSPLFAISQYLQAGYILSIRCKIVGDV